MRIQIMVDKLSILLDQGVAYWIKQVPLALEKLILPTDKLGEFWAASSIYASPILENVALDANAFQMISNTSFYNSKHIFCNN